MWLSVGCIVSVVIRGEDMTRVSEATLEKRQRRDVGYRNFNRMLDLILQEGVKRDIKNKGGTGNECKEQQTIN
jgi:hypothetical protein